MTNAVSFNPTEETIVSDDILTDVDAVNGGLNGLFNMKVRQSKLHLSDPSGHDVTLNITFSMAIPGVFSNVRGNESFSTRNSLADPMRSGNQYFHIEFDLFDKNVYKDTCKTDVVFWGTYAKIYPDRSDSKVIPTWSDGEDTWISWIQRFTFKVSLPHLQSLSQHSVVVKVWDTKDKCLPKTRFDHPKPPKSSNRSRSLNDITSWIKETVMMMSHDFSKTASFLENPDRILPHQIISSGIFKKDTDDKRIKSGKSTATTKSSAPTPDSAVKEKELLLICGEPKDDPDTNLGSYTQLEKLLETKPTNNPRNESLSKKVINSSSVRQIEQSHTARPESRKSAIVPAELEKYNKMGRLCLTVSTAELFLADQTISRASTSISSLEDMFCMISLESDLLSAEQKLQLNPLTINIRKIKNLPNKNDDFSDINRQYLPLYCEYQFCDLEPHKTVTRIQNRTVKFDDVSVIMLGTLPPLSIKNQLQNSFLIIKMFDRIENPQRKTDDDENALTSDINIGDVSITSSSPTMTKVSINRPRGEAKIDLSELMKNGLKYLEIMVPIVPISDSGIKPDIEPLKKYPEDCGCSYLESGTSMKVSLKLAHRLVLPLETIADKVYNRIVIVNSNRTCEFVSKEVVSEILRHNCQILNFISAEKAEMQTFLFSVSKKLTEHDDLFTGVYIVDRRYEVVIIESTQDCIKQLYELCSSRLDQYQEKHSGDLKFLYNESLCFGEKSDFTILTMLPLILSKDIEFYVSQPLLYVRDMLPRECVDGICRIKELVNTDSMHIALRNQLIPSCYMVESISQYLCSHINDERGKVVVVESKIVDQSTRSIQRNGVKTAPLRERTKVKPPIRRSESQISTAVVFPKTGCEFSYSCQTLNSISSARKLIREKLDPKRRYTYSQNYLLSGTFDPMDLEETYKLEEQWAKSEPRWTNKGSQSSLKDATDGKVLPESRKEELKSQWIENTLHRSFMEPTLPERDQRTFNFDLYIRPLDILNRDPQSIMPSYCEQKKIDNNRRKTDWEMWNRKVCVSDVKFRSHRLLPETEMTERGRLSSNQIAKLQGLRKEETRLKLKNDPNKIPGIYVIESAGEDAQSYTIGPSKDRNLLVNYVPVVEHDKDFNAVFRASRDTFIHKNTINNGQSHLESPFSVYG